MLFSVIVTALNAGEKLMQTVDSVLSQSFPDYEIIVQDGGLLVVKDGAKIRTAGAGCSRSPTRGSTTA